MKNGTEKYIDTVNYLGKLYDYINIKLFKGELVKPVITVQQDARNKFMVGGRAVKFGKRTQRTTANMN